jgi:hypothetical protein
VVKQADAVAVSLFLASCCTVSHCMCLSAPGLWCWAHGLTSTNLLRLLLPHTSAAADAAAAASCCSDSGWDVFRMRDRDAKTFNRIRCVSTVFC